MFKKKQINKYFLPYQPRVNVAKLANLQSTVSLHFETSCICTACMTPNVANVTSPLTPFSFRRARRVKSVAPSKNLPFTEHINGQWFSPLVEADVRPLVVLRRTRDLMILARFLHLAGIFAEDDGVGPFHGQLGRLPHRVVLGIRVVVDPHLAAQPSTCCALQLFPHALSAQDSLGVWCAVVRA